MNRMHRKKLSLAIMNAMNAGVVVSLAVPMAVYAQQPISPVVSDVAKAVTPEKMEKIEVTGSRLPSLTIESVSPVNVISAQDIKWDGIYNTSDIINQLPSAFADQGQNLSNGATGTSSVNLRNLGPSRTLVLIDGRRLPAGSPNSWPTDVNAIPAPLIQRVEVLTGGASAVYGSDAVAGVVNFIMNDHFEGVQVQWNANGYNHQQQDTLASLQALATSNPNNYSVPGDVSLDGRQQNFNMLLGGNFANGKGNATLYFNYQKSDAVLQGTRNFSSCALSSNKTTFVCGGGSVTSRTGYFYSPSANGVAYTIADRAGNARPFNAVTDAFNFAPYNFYQRPLTEYGFNAFAHYDALPNVRVYAEFDFSNNHTDAQIAPGGVFFQDTYVMKNSNPLLSQSFKDAFGITAAQDATLYIGRRNVEGGGRVNQINLEDYRYVIGAKGAVFEDTWNYNFWWQSGTNRLESTNINYFSRAKITKALDVVTDPNTGRPACASFVNGTDTACVPYDIFHLGGVTPAALAYLNAPSFQTGFTSQSVVGFQVDSDLGTSYGWRTPWSKDGAAIALGIERRVEKLQRNADLEGQSGDQSGSGGAAPDITGQYTVREFYAEGRLPLAQRQPWAYLLSINGSYRNSSYNQPSNTTNTYGLGAEWAPVKEYKLRGTYQQAIRAPNIVELYTPLGLNLFNMANDPCAGGAPTQAVPTATLAQCLRTGLNPADYGKRGLNSPTGQYQFQQGGNPLLEPEKAKTYTLGLVAQPLPNLSGTVDYWNIKLENAIGVIPQPLILSACLQFGELCDQIHRDARGTLWTNGFTGGVTTNTGTNSTDGVDVTLAWTQPITDWGSVGVTLVGTYVNTFKFQIGSVTADCAGHFGTICGTPIPTWRSKLRGTWNTPWSWNAALTWRYFDSVTLDSSTGSPALQSGFNPPDQKLGTQNYIDLAASWDVNKNFTIYGGCNNIFDRDPPVLSSSIAGPPFGNGNTYPQVYDTLGRQFFVSVTAKF